MRTPPRIEPWLTDEQISKLRSMLDLEGLHDQEEKLGAIVAIISVHFETCWRHVHYRRSVGRESDAKDNLKRISSLSKELARRLSKEPALTSLLFPPERITKERLGRPGMSLQLIRRIGARPKELLDDLEVIAKETLRHVADRFTSTRARQLLPEVTLTDKEMFIASQILWPTLFDIWHDVGKEIATTDNGPLHRFIKFVHSVGDLPAPSRSTLRGPIAKWKQDMVDE